MDKETKAELDVIQAKLDEILSFQHQLHPFLPMLKKLLDNPAARFKSLALGRQK